MNDVTPLTFVGIALVVAYWAWLWAFFTHVRPRIMARLGARLAVRVRESTSVLDAGTFDTTDEAAPLARRGIVIAADLAVLMAGVVGVAAAVFVPAFLVAERGWLLPVEGWLTGRRAFVDASDATMSARGRTDAEVVVRNAGRLALRACALATEGYSARSGYVHGRSATFELEAGDTKKTVLVLEAQKPVPGRHRIAIELECETRRVAATTLALDVR